MSEPPSEKVYMLNALWFKPDGGAEKYREYMAAVAPFVLKYGGQKLDAYTPVQAIIGDFDADLVFFVAWPDWESFTAFVTDPDFQNEAQPLRDAAIEKSLLIRCAPVV